MEDPVHLVFKLQVRAKLSLTETNSMRDPIHPVLNS